MSALVAGSIVVELEALHQGFAKGMGIAQNKIEDVSKSAGKLAKGGISNLQTGFTKASDMLKTGLIVGLTGLTAGLIGVGKKALDSSAEMESFSLQLETAFRGNAKLAKEAGETITKFAAKTPYDLAQVMDSFIKLKNLGLDPSERALTSYGNTASAMGKPLNQMIEAVADAATGEFERLKEFGIKSSKQGDQVAFTFGGVTTKIKNDSKSIQGYLLNLGETKFAGSMEKQSTTFAGLMSTMSDTVSQKLSALGKNTGFLDFAKNAVTAITNVADKVDIDKIITSIETGFNRLKGVVTPVIDSFDKINKNGEVTRSLLFGLGAVAVPVLAMALWGLITPTLLVAAPLVAVGAAAAGLFYIFETNKPLFVALVAGFGSIGMAILISYIPAMIAATTANLALIGSMLLAAAPFALLGLAVGALAFVIYSNWDDIKQWTSETWNWISIEIGRIWEGIKTVCGGALQFVAGLFTGNKKDMEEGVSKMLGGLKQIFENVFRGIKGFVSGVIDGIVNTAKGAIDWVNQALGKQKELTAAEKYNNQFSTQTNGNTVTKIPNFATGTDFFSGGLAQVNEKGGEIMNLPNGTQIIPNDISKIMAQNAGSQSNTSQNIALNINGNYLGTERDKRQLVRDLKDAINQVIPTTRNA